MKKLFTNNSVQSIFEEAKDTLIRFPLVLLSTAIGTFFLIKQTYYNNENIDQLELIIRIALSCALAIPLLFSLKNLSERRNFSSVKTYLIQLIGIGIILLYFFQKSNFKNEDDRLFYIVLNLIFHLFVSFAPFLSKNEWNGFWQYNQRLFLRMAISAFYTIVLGIGISLALVAINLLFKIEIDARAYLRTWTLLIGIFNTWVFLAGAPRNTESLEQNHEYPIGLKIFTQYILLPLIILYIVILYIYEFNVIIKWQLPEGWISYLIISFSIASLLALLLIQPIAKQEKSKWLYLFSRIYFILLIPLIILLFIAIGRRIYEYGITPERYYVALIACWLAGIIIFNIINRFRNIKIIPISLAIISLLSILGPWNAFRISAYNQLHILKKVLYKNELIVNGKIKPTQNSTAIPFEDQKKISSAIEYLTRRERTDLIQPFFDFKLDTLGGSNDYSYYYKAQKIVEKIGIDFVNNWQTIATSEEKNSIEKYYNFNRASNQAIDIKDFDYQVPISFSEYSVDTISFEATNNKINLLLDSNKKSITAFIKGKKLINIPIENLFSSLRNKYNSESYVNDLPYSILSLYAENENCKTKIVLNFINFTVKKNSNYEEYIYYSFDGFLYITLKK